MKTAIDSGVYINSHVGVAGWTPLIASIFASNNGHNSEIFQLISAAKPDFQRADHCGNSPLVWACYYGKSDIVATLLKEEVPVDACNLSGDSALSACLCTGPAIPKRGAVTGVNNKPSEWIPMNFTTPGVDLAKLLVEAGANMKRTDSFGQTMLMKAAKSGMVPSVVFLLTRGMDVDAQDDSGLTALMWAAISGQQDMVGVLLKYGAKINAADNKGRSSLFLLGRDDLKEFYFENPSQRIKQSIKVPPPKNKSEMIAFLRDNGAKN